MQLKDKSETLYKQVESILVPIELLSVGECQGIIKRYVAAFQGNFQYWLATILVSARSALGRSTAEQNFQIEIRENHCSMLRDFAVDANAQPDAIDFYAVSKSVERVNSLVAELSGLKCMALIAILENDWFIYSYLESLARKAGSNNFTYTKIHKTEDMDHAEQFYQAFLAEVEMESDSLEESIDDLISILSELYFSIFVCKN